MNRLGRLMTPSQILSEIASDFSGDEDRSNQSLIDAALYVTEFLTRAHPDVGRSGAVCPFAAPALRRDSIMIAVSRQNDANAGSMMCDIARLREAFVIESDDVPLGDAEMYRAFMIVFPYLPLAEAADLIKSVQKDLKPSFVERGLMVGEFFPNCAAPGLHNPEFHPLDTPFYSLAIRRMNAADAPFMLESDRFVSAYLDRFGADGEKRMRALTEKNICPDDRRQPILDLIEARQVDCVESIGDLEVILEPKLFIVTGRQNGSCPHAMNAVSSLNAA